MCQPVVCWCFGGPFESRDLERVQAQVRRVTDKMTCTSGASEAPHHESAAATGEADEFPATEAEEDALMSALHRSGASLPQRNSPPLPIDPLLPPLT